MIYLMQIVKMLNKNQIRHFIALFEDLTYEIEELGYKGMETELVNDMLMNHFGLEIECENQLSRLTDSILKNQGRFDKTVNTACLMIGKGRA